MATRKWLDAVRRFYENRAKFENGYSVKEFLEIWRIKRALAPKSIANNKDRYDKPPMV